MSKIFPTKTLLASSTIALGLLAVLGSAQAQQFGQSKPSVVASRQIEVLPGNSAQQPETELRGDNRADAPAAAGTDAPDAKVADASAAPQDTPTAEPQADTAPVTTQSEPKIIVSEEAKRLNRQRYVERYEVNRYAEPRYAEPRYVEPRQYAQRDAYAQRYQAAPSYGYVQRRTAEHCAPRSY